VLCDVICGRSKLEGVCRLPMRMDWVYLALCGVLSCDCMLNIQGLGTWPRWNIQGSAGETMMAGLESVLERWRVG
jgi:hypothetical protein